MSKKQPDPNKRDSLIFYRSFYDSIKELPEKNQLEVYNSIFEYSLNFSESELTGVSKTVFILIKPLLSANNKRFKNGSKPKAKDKQNGSKTEGNKDKDDNVNKDNNNNENKDDIHTKHFHLQITEIQYQKLCDDLGKKSVDDLIEKIKSYSRDYLKKYSDLNKVIRNWLKKPETSKSDIPQWIKEQNAKNIGYGEIK